MLLHHALSIIVLAGVMVLGNGLGDSQAVMAREITVASDLNSLVSQAPQSGSHDANTHDSIRLPQPLINSVRRDVAQKTGVPPGKVKITEVSRAMYPNSCLGLPRPDEVCAEVLVAGFRIVAFPDISDTGRVRPFIYRSDLAGRNLRWENDFAATPSKLPAAVADAVLQDASQRTGRPVSELKIVQAQRRTWPNGCLGLSEPNVMCTQALVEGWLVVINGPGGVQLTYRTNASGSVVKLDPAASSTGKASTIKPVVIPTRELPAPLKQGEVFRVISSGGITGRTTTITLQTDGRVVQSLVLPNGQVTASKTLFRRTPQQVRSFQRLLNRQQFARLNRLSYPAPSGAADFFTITLSSQKTTVRYTDLVQNRLPGELQQVIQAFERLTGKEQL